MSATMAYTLIAAVGLALVTAGGKSRMPKGYLCYRTTGPARDLLMRIYDAQKAYHQEHRRWAATLAELELSSLPDTGLAQPPTLALTPDGYVATVGAKVYGGQFRRLHIRQDSRLWTDGP